MTILRDVFAELFSMFVGDAWLTFSILVVVAIAAALIAYSGLPPLAGGAVLVVGCLAVLLGGVYRTSLAS